MAEFFRFLVETNLITSAFVIGAGAFIIAIIGKVKTIIEPSPAMRIVLAVFGLFLMVSSVGGYVIVSLQADSEDSVETSTHESVAKGSDNSNLVYNGDFEKSIGNNWIFQVWGGEATVVRDMTAAGGGAASAHISVSEPAAEDWHISFWQQDIDLVGGDNYTLSFYARASEPLSFRVIIQNQVEPFEGFAEAVEIFVESSWQEFSLPFTASHNSQGEAKVVFALGNTQADIWLDNIVLNHD